MLSYTQLLLYFEFVKIFVNIFSPFSYINIYIIFLDFVSWWKSLQYFTLQTFIETVCWLLWEWHPLYLLNCLNQLSQLVAWQTLQYSHVLRALVLSSLFLPVFTVFAQVLFLGELYEAMLGNTFSKSGLERFGNMQNIRSRYYVRKGWLRETKRLHRM